MDRDTKRFVTRELWVEHGVSRIYGVLHLPKGAEHGTPLPAVICSHFFGGTHRTSSKYARALATQGFVIYAFDFCGGSPESRSTGVTTDCSIRTEEADLPAALGAMPAEFFCACGDARAGHAVMALGRHSSGT